MSELIEDLNMELEQSKHWRGSNGFRCECDPSTGAVPCPVCYQRDLLKRAIAEITALRQRKEVKKLRHKLIKSQWINVKDRLPKASGDYIVACEGA